MTLGNVTRILESRSIQVLDEIAKRRLTRIQRPQAGLQHHSPHFLQRPFRTRQHAVFKPLHVEFQQHLRLKYHTELPSRVIEGHEVHLHEPLCAAAIELLMRSSRRQKRARGRMVDMFSKLAAAIPVAQRQRKDHHSAASCSRHSLELTTRALAGFKAEDMCLRKQDQRAISELANVRTYVDDRADRVRTETVERVGASQLEPGRLEAPRDQPHTETAQCVHSFWISRTDLMLPAEILHS